MRNLKKVLALVLSLVMALSLVTVVGAASVGETYADADKIGSEYMEAAEVLNGLKLFEGNGESFNPGESFTRAQLAGILYRVHSKDTAGYGNDKSGSYKIPAFSDVPADQWYAGYIGYCYMKNLVKGDTDGKYNPDGLVTGYQVLAAMLRLAGYTEEFTGDYWYLEVLSKADEEGLLDTVKDASKLSETATRQGVCDMVFHVLTEVETVKYNSTTKDYVKQGTTMGAKNFDLEKGEEVADADKWGAPAFAWTKDGKPIASAAVAPYKTYENGTTQKAIATLLKLGDTAVPFEVYENGVKKDNISLNKSSGATAIGGNGSVVDVYYETDDDGAAVVARIVVTDEFLAVVTDVDDSAVELTVYNKAGGTDMKVYDDEFPYEKDTYILVKAAGATPNSYKQDKDGKAIDADKQTLKIVGEAGSVTAKQTNPVVTGSTVTKRTVDGKTYENQKSLLLNPNVKDLTKTYTWYLSTAGYIIGAEEYSEDGPVTADVFYGVITSISATLTADVDGADVTVKRTNNTDSSIKVKSFNLINTTAGADLGDANIHTLVPVYYVTDNSLMQKDGSEDNLRVSPVAKKNADNDSNYDVVEGHLFKFVSDGKGAYTATEVGGDGAAATGASDANKAAFKDLYSAAGNASNKTLYKAYGRLPLNGGATVLVGNSTKLIVRELDDENKTKSIKTYTGTSLLSGDVDLQAYEVDWVQGADDEYATYVYLTGKPQNAKDTTIYTYGLFYFDGKTADLSTDKNDKTLYTLEGYLDGVKTTLTFGEADGKAIVETSSTYAGHIFAVKMSDSGNTTLLARTGVTAATKYQLVPLADSAKKVGDSTVVNGFKCGAEYGNEYDASKTYVVYDTVTTNTSADGYTNKTLTTDNDTYYGNAANVRKGAWTDLKKVDESKDIKTFDVTIVYDELTSGGDKMIRDIYISARPSAAPSGGSSSGASDASKLSIADVPPEANRVTISKNTDGTAKTDEVIIALQDGKDVVAIGNITSGVYQLGENQTLKVMGNVTAKVVMKDTSKLIVTGDYTTDADQDTLKGTIVAGSIVLKPHTGDNKLTIAEGAVLVADDGETYSSDQTKGKMTLSANIILTNNGTIRVAGQLDGSASTVSVTNNGPATAKSVLGTNMTWVELSDNCLTVSTSATFKVLKAYGTVDVGTTLGADTLKVGTSSATDDASAIAAKKAGTVKAGGRVTLGDNENKVVNGSLTIKDGDLAVGTTGLTVSGGSVTVTGESTTGVAAKISGAALSLGANAAVSAPEIDTSSLTVNGAGAKLTVSKEITSTVTTMDLTKGTVDLADEAKISSTVAPTVTKDTKITLGAKVDVTANEYLKSSVGGNKTGEDASELKGGAAAGNDFRVAAISMKTDNTDYTDGSSKGGKRLENWVKAQGRDSTRAKNTAANMIGENGDISSSGWGNAGVAAGNLFVYVDWSNILTELEAAKTAQNAIKISSITLCEKGTSVNRIALSTEYASGGWTIENPSANPDHSFVDGFVANINNPGQMIGGQSEYAWGGAEGKTCVLTVTITVYSGNTDTVLKNYTASIETVIPAADFDDSAAEGNTQG